MLSKYSNNRTLGENIRLAVLTAFSAGMVNVAALIIFFSFASNVTGHYAILAAEIAKGNWYQVAVVFAWILLFCFGSFTSNYIVINYNKANAYLAHSTPIILEIICLLIVGFYGHFFYRETLIETEALLALMLFAMGLQNGLTASISNGAVKTTHLTGATTDIGIMFSMLTKKENRQNQEVVGKTVLLVSTAGSYLTGAVISGMIYLQIGFKIFFLVSAFLVVVIMYDWYLIKLKNFLTHEHNKPRSKWVPINANKVHNEENQREVPAY